MTAPEHFAIGSNQWAGLLKLVEEAGELIQVAGKLLATGGAVEHWEGSYLGARLGEEIADVLAAATFFLEHNVDRLPVDITGRIADKVELFDQWHEEQHA